MNFYSGYREGPTRRALNEPRKSHFRLPPGLRSIPHLSGKPDHEAARSASDEGVSRSSFPHFGPHPSLFLPVSSCPQPPSIPRLRASPLQKPYLPQTHNYEAE